MNNLPILPNGASLYGNYRTRTFSEIWEDVDKFIDEWFNGTPFSAEVEGALSNKITLIYYLLYSRYGNSNIASSDETRFKFQLFSIVFQYGPNWKRELEIQKELRELDIEEFQKGNTNIVNNASNPSIAPTTQTTEELTYINAQNVSKTKRSKADGYALLLSLLKDDVTEKFLDRFKKLFLTIVEPEEPLWYITEV